MIKFTDGVSIHTLINTLFQSPVTLLIIHLQLLVLSPDVAVGGHVLLHQLHQFLVVQCLQLVLVYPEGALAGYQAWCCVRWDAV